MTDPRSTADAWTVDIDGRRLQLTNLDRVLWPKTGFTKRAMLEYLLEIAPVLLPHLHGRGVTLRRFPEGVEGPGWYQANCRGLPDWMRIQEVVGRRGAVLRYCRIEERAALAWVANLGTIELHPFIGTAERPSEPTALVLDLDPGPPGALVASARVAREARDVLSAAGVASFVKSSGSIGLHVFAPLEPGYTFREAKAAARAVAAELARRLPDLLIDRIDRTARAGRVFVDWVQNDESRSTVAPYSLRATPWPLVSTPLAWQEIDDAIATGDVRRLVFGPSDVLARVRARGDLFAGVLVRDGKLPHIAPDGQLATSLTGT
jgi:bifunctional non-homologous end joining protein LigD